jgi:FkbM family methyltransferase
VPLRAVLAAFNRLPLWRRHVQVWGFRLRAPTFDRCLYLWLHRLGRMGRADRAFLEANIRPGMQIADIGSNIGLYTLLLARLAGPGGRVHAFEPDPLMVGFLRQNLAAAGVSTVEVFPCAAGAAAGEAVLQRHAINSGDNRLGTATGGAWHRESHAVPVRALGESLGARPLDLIKIDVQGWEAEVFRGLGGLLDANPRLRIYFELWPDGLARAGTSVAELASLLDELRLRTTVPGGGEPVDVARLASGMRPGAYTNLLAARLPASR